MQGNLVAHPAVRQLIICWHWPWLQSTLEPPAHMMAQIPKGYQMSICAPRKLRNIAAIAVGLSAAMSSTMTYAQDTTAGGTSPAEQAKPPLWTSQCVGASRSAPLDCSMEQRLILEGSGQFLARLMIRLPASTTVPVFLIQLPLGVSLPAGVDLNIDDLPETKLGFQTCDKAGCYVGGTLSNSMTNAMKAGNVVTISFEDSAKRPIKLNFSLSGFTKAFEAVSNS